MNDCAIKQLLGDSSVMKREEEESKSQSDVKTFKIVAVLTD